MEVGGPRKVSVPLKSLPLPGARLPPPREHWVVMCIVAFRGAAEAQGHAGDGRGAAQAGEGGGEFRGGPGDGRQAFWLGAFAGGILGTLRRCLSGPLLRSCIQRSLISKPLSAKWDSSQG